LPQEIIENIVYIPEGVSFTLDEKKVKISGEKGDLVKDFGHTDLNLYQGDELIRVWINNPRKRKAAQVNTVASHIRNMIKGVTEEHLYKMKVVFIHFPMTIMVQGDLLVIENFIGERKPRTAKIMPNVEVKVDGDDLLIRGVDIEAVGQTAANIQQACKIRNKDLRKFLDGIYVYSKE
jgi:large subunit ribosomal protein L6